MHPSQRASIAGPVSEVTLMSLPFWSVRRMTTERARKGHDIARPLRGEEIETVILPNSQREIPPPQPQRRGSYPPTFVDPGRHGRLGVLSSGHRVLDDTCPF